MKNTKPTTRKKKIVPVNPETYPFKAKKPTKAQHELADLRELININYDRTTNVLHSLNTTDEDVGFLYGRQQVMFWVFAVATLLGAVNFIWLCIK